MTLTYDESSEIPVEALTVSEITKDSKEYPYTQLKEMYNDIKIREVDTQSKSHAYQMGIIRASSQVMDYDPDDPTKNGETIYTVQKGAWQDDDATLKDVTPSTFTLASVINTIMKTQDYSETLLQNLISQGETEFKYYGDTAYGHGTVDEPVGTITRELVKTIASGEGSIPDAHNTTVTNEENNGNPVGSTR